MRLLGQVVGLELTHLLFESCSLNHSSSFVLNSSSFESLLISGQLLRSISHGCTHVASEI